MTFDSTAAVLDATSPAADAVDSRLSGLVAAQQPDQKPKSPSRATTKTAKIMIVDDEPINVKVVQKHLQGHGYSNFVTTTISTTALATAERERPDIILLDIMMPEVSGMDILQQVREHADLHRVPVLILTAVGDAKVKQEALQYGANDFLTKPVDSSELVLRVGNLLVVKAHYDHLENYSVHLEQQVRARTVELHGVTTRARADAGSRS